MDDSLRGRFKAIVNLTDSAVFCQTGKHLSSTEVLVLEACGYNRKSFLGKAKGGLGRPKEAWREIRCPRS